MRRLRTIALGWACPFLLAASMGLAAPPDDPHWDWREVDGHSYVSGVRNQGACGSSYAFPSVSMLESAMMIVGNLPDMDLDYSEQQVVSCMPGGGCDGGSPSTALAFLRDTGTPPEICFPYQASDLPCDQPCGSVFNQQIDSYSTISYGYPNPSGLKTALAAGPVMVTIEAYQCFSIYTGGIYTRYLPTHMGLHALLLVGYDDTEQYWVCKNCYGATWGEDGYIRISYDDNCEFGYYAWSCDYSYDATGTVFIDTTPDTLDAPWHLEGSMGFVRDGNGDETGLVLPTGEYTLSWIDVPGWISPDPDSLTFSLGVNDTITFSGTYIEIVDDPDVIGLFTSSAGHGETTVGVPPFTWFDVYLVIHNPSHPSDIDGWECAVDVPSNLWVNYVLTGQAINVGTPPDFVVSVTPPLLREASVMVMTLECAATNEAPAPIYLRGTTPSSVVPPAPCYSPANDDPEMPLTVYSGAEEIPVFVVNPGLASVDEPTSSRNLVLHANYPNPFNPTTTIRYELAKPTRVALRIYDVSGKLVRILRDGVHEQAGRYEAIWRGKDSSGSSVASGTYFYRLTAGPYTETRRMVLVR